MHEHFSTTLLFFLQQDSVRSPWAPHLNRGMLGMFWSSSRRPGMRLKFTVGRITLTWSLFKALMTGQMYWNLLTLHWLHWSGLDSTKTLIVGCGLIKMRWQHFWVGHLSNQTTLVEDRIVFIWPLTDGTIDRVKICIPFFATMVRQYKSLVFPFSNSFCSLTFLDVFNIFG